MPIYNVEQYLEACLNSITNQSIKDIEVILVNDGSTDSSEKIANKFVKKDSRLKLINQDNKGLSAARNVGIEAANGEYIYFIDSDDYIIGNDSLKEMIELLEKNKSDIVVGKLIRIYEKKDASIECSFLDFFKDDVWSTEDYIKLCSRFNWVPVWLYIYRKSFIVENNIKFKEGFLHEDEDFTPKVILKSKRISIYKKAFYGI